MIEFTIFAARWLIADLPSIPAMNIIQTNRDLYRAVAALIQERRESERLLEEYLRALFQAAQPFAQRESLSLQEFFGLLAVSFTAPAAAFDEGWRARFEEDLARRSGFAGWQARLIRQVVDLREMDERGTLRNEMRYFGIDSPRGQCWYNFDPCTFLECGATGTFGGWQEGDSTGRQFVPGPVAVLGADGQIEARDPRDVPDAVVPLPALTWETFRDFLGNGQWYE